MDISKVQSERIIDKGVNSAKSSDRIAKQDQKTKSTSVTNQSSSEQVKWSDDAQLLAEGVDAVKNAPDARAEKIAALKAKIASGTYNIDSDAIADKMIHESLADDLLTRKG